MGYGSYYQSDYYRNPRPYTSSDIGEPIPGWGLNPRSAGPSMIAMGNSTPTLSKTALYTPLASRTGVTFDPGLSQQVVTPKTIDPTKIAAAIQKGITMPVREDYPIESAQASEHVSGQAADGTSKYLWAALGLGAAGLIYWKFFHNK